MSKSPANAEKGPVAPGPRRRPQRFVSKSREHREAGRQIAPTGALAERVAASGDRPVWPRRQSGGVRPPPAPCRGVACPPASPVAQKRGGRVIRSYLIYASQTIKKYKRTAPRDHARGCILCLAAGNSTVCKLCFICSKQRA